MLLHRSTVIPGTITLACALLFEIIGRTMWIGRLVYRFYPCEQELTNSFPCFGIYDIYAMIAVAIVGALSFLALLFNLVQAYRHRSAR